jgi:hypothetical protein
MANEQNTSNNLSLVSQNSKITTVMIIWFSIYSWFARDVIAVMLVYR